MNHDVSFRLIFAVLIIALSAVQLTWRIYLHHQTRPSTKKIGGVGEFGVLIAMPLWVLSVMAYPFDFEWFDLSAPLAPWLRWFGVAGLIICLPLSVWIFRSLGSSFSPKLQLSPDHQLVSSGPYRFVRHPMYATFFLCAFSASLVSANLIIALTGVAAITALALRIKNEEAMLLERFGQRYVEYAEKTGVVIPRCFLSF